MTAIKWFLFLPVGFALIFLAQVLAGLLIGCTAWWIGLPILFFFGVIVAMAGMIPVKMVSNPPVAASILLTLFIGVEIFALWSGFDALELREKVGRILVDVQLVIGALLGAQQEDEGPVTP
ncbi:hypothetical protein [Luteolibacter marinus]|uniref:hypothetical protein n=1 Tax=Luteolibacter marinus TaxID=2776705 RepID=UPI001865DDF7|nr:hypothetical protein [Luteolibacter marinus]